MDRLFWWAVVLVIAVLVGLAIYRFWRWLLRAAPVLAAVAVGLTQAASSTRAPI